MSGSVGSPLVATGRVGTVFIWVREPRGSKAQVWGEDKIWMLDRSPPVVSEGGEEKRKFDEAGSQKATSTPLAALEMGRVGAKARHSARQAAVRTSPFQQAGMRAPAGVHPGH